MSTSGAFDPLYVLARRVLLDALEALGPHRAAVILIGAQAIYLHTGDTGLSVVPYTTDADIALNPERLAARPPLEVALRAAGFELRPDQPGTWNSPDARIPIDLMVAEALGGGGRRAARLGPVHGNRVARKGLGLEAAVVDSSPLVVGALDLQDPRRIEVAVAGPAALLVMKLHKLADRQQTPTRLDDKDALDVYRLLQTIPLIVFLDGFERLTASSLSARVSRQALDLLQVLFSSPTATGSSMAARALAPIEDPATIAASCAALAADLFAAVHHSG
jgi:hypothetical protein